MISCVISIDYEKDSHLFTVYVLDENNRWFYLAQKKDLKSAVYFSMHFYMCHSNFTRLSINYMFVS